LPPLHSAFAAAGDQSWIAVPPIFEEMIPIGTEPLSLRASAVPKYLLQQTKPFLNPDMPHLASQLCARFLQVLIENHWRAHQPTALKAPKSDPSVRSCTSWTLALEPTDQRCSILTAPARPSSRFGLLSAGSR